MIKLNDKTIEINRFPDGTLRVDPNALENRQLIGTEATITWHYENNEEMVLLLFLTRHLQNSNCHIVNLVMPYIPNARQDRVKRMSDVFTLKYFSEFINSLNFNTVTVLDPHSSVSEALINNIVIEKPDKYIQRVFNSVYTYPENKDKYDTLMAFYPDEGAMKRYSENIGVPYVFGIKRRNWSTGKIEGLDIAGETELIKGRNVLIIDDISSRGGTFYHSAKKLKELGANHIYLYITHCERTILDGEIFKSGLIDKVFTTNSIFRDKEIEYAKELGVASKMEVFAYEKD